MKLIVGLGNPGKKHSQTRHNIGFAVVDRLAVYCRVQLRRLFYPRAWIGKANFGNDSCLLVKPCTYMNNSGSLVAGFLTKHKIAWDELLVIYDDADLNLGVIRLRKAGSAGGHKGMASVIRAAGQEEISRLRLGIGKPPENELADYVLKEFLPEEKPQVERVIAKAAEMSTAWIEKKEEKTITVH